jgi:hypothetical protein
MTDQPKLIILDRNYHECDWPGCLAAAAWTFAHICGAPTFECDGHRRQHDRILASGKTATCRKCGMRGANPLPWRPVSQEVTQ